MNTELKNKLTGYAKQDILSVIKHGDTAICNTKKGALFVNYSDGKFSFSWNMGRNGFVTNSKQTAIDFVVENYQIS